jgi:hypothetical protein
LVSCKPVKLASDPLTTNFFQFGISMFYYGWQLKMSPLPLWPIIYVINMRYLFIIERSSVKILKF